MILLFVVVISCSKEDSVDKQDIKSDDPKYEIDLSLANKNDTVMSNRILELENIHRASLGLGHLQKDSLYASAFAVQHTEYMIEKGEIGHDNSYYRFEAIRYHCGAQGVGENVAAGYGTAETALEGWMNSPGHRAIIEGNYSHTGFGIMKNSEGRIYFTQIFYRK